MDIDDFVADEKMETDGVWFDDFGDDSRFLIAADQNPKHLAKLDELILPHLKALRPQDDASQEVKDVALKLQRDLSLQAEAECILLRFENVTNKGEPFPYNEGNALIFMQSRRLRQAVMLRARNLANYRIEVSDSGGKD